MNSGSNITSTFITKRFFLANFAKIHLKNKNIFKEGLYHLHIQYCAKVLGQG